MAKLFGALCLPLVLFLALPALAAQSEPWSLPNSPAPDVDETFPVNVGDITRRRLWLDEAGDAMVTLINYRNTTPQPSPGGCVSSDLALCLWSNRFKVEVNWGADLDHNGAVESNEYGWARVRAALDGTSGVFWFFTSVNSELFVKVVNACSFVTAHRYWVFVSGLTNVYVWVRVTDTATGEQWSLEKMPGPAFPAVQDTDAFSTCT